MPILSCCQIFRPVVTPAVQMTCLCGMALAHGLSVEHPWNSQFQNGEFQLGSSLTGKVLGDIMDCKVKLSQPGPRSSYFPMLFTPPNLRCHKRIRLSDLLMPFLFKHLSFPFQVLPSAPPSLAIPTSLRRHKEVRIHTKSATD